jgi:hypothetical protein
MLDPKSVSTVGPAARRPRLVRADSKLRNKWLAIVTTLFIVLALLLWVSPSVQSYLVKMFSDDTSGGVFRLLVIFYSLFAILAIILITIGIHLIQVARGIQHLGNKGEPGPAFFISDYGNSSSVDYWWRIYPILFS